ncbi:conserved hypothetical protein [Neospora caninum Liverpool]|nr:conserved hypothetical protein [Neospora caninum Liverpool]CBZ54926.1 conserved hypothetical protein [Neospora caninum Liverpool]|eukprot:XP_003884954.1 conserved hypothetical protein [Neospora caninum Liverpool]
MEQGEETKQGVGGSGGFICLASEVTSFSDAPQDAGSEQSLASRLPAEKGLLEEKERHTHVDRHLRGDASVSGLDLRCTDTSESGETAQNVAWPREALAEESHEEDGYVQVAEGTGVGAAVPKESNEGGETERKEIEKTRPGEKSTCVGNRSHRLQAGDSSSRDRGFLSGSADAPHHSPEPPEAAFVAGASTTKISASPSPLTPLEATTPSSPPSSQTSSTGVSVADISAPGRLPSLSSASPSAPSAPPAGDASDDVSAFFTIEVHGDVSLESEILSSFSSSGGENFRRAVEAETARWHVQSPGLGAAYALLHARLFSRLLSLGALRRSGDSRPEAKRRKLAEDPPPLQERGRLEAATAAQGEANEQRRASFSCPCEGEHYELCGDVLAGVVRDAQLSAARECQGGWANCIRRVFARSGAEKENRYFFEDGSPALGGRRPLLPVFSEAPLSEGRKRAQTGGSSETETKDEKPLEQTKKRDGNAPTPSGETNGEESVETEAVAAALSSLSHGSSLPSDVDQPFCALRRNGESRDPLSFTWRDWEMHHRFVLASHQSSMSICFFCGRRACPRSENSRIACPASRCEQCCQRGHRAFRSTCNRSLALLHRIEEAFEARFAASMREDRQDIRCVQCGGSGHFICGEAPASEG